MQVSRMADYAVLVIHHMSQQPGALHNAADVATALNLGAPTVMKIMKQLTKGGILNSTRGVKGGYQLARATTCISVANVVEAIDGPICLTRCQHKNNTCQIKECCDLEGSWQLINDEVRATLQKICIHDLPHLGGR